MNKQNKRLAVAFTGPSNSGKTTLIEQISIVLHNEGFKVAIVKHDPKDKAKFDKEGKDSYRFSQTGADVAILSDTRTTLFKQQRSEINDVIDMFGHFDFLLVEGLKTIPLPRICVQREALNQNYFEVSDSLAIDESIDKEQIPKDMNILDLNNINQIIQWIKNNAKEV
ncbi:molybdopterin-guanine dinucleotide biosynthesis protein B [Arcobacteraceae bacterium]|nr:molybdopterin-guanine dinucleotide biosynthesis protein B [Arcobacteraceae bacterium]